MYIEDVACPHCHRGGGPSYSFNLTHNVNSIVDLCLVAGGATKGKSDDNGYQERSWGRLHGWTVAEVTPIVAKALDESLRADRIYEFKALEPSNGWGSLGSVRRVLSEFHEALLQAPQDSVIRTSG